jgi:hypothetical protein
MDDDECRVLYTMRGPMPNPLIDARDGRCSYYVSIDPSQSPDSNHQCIDPSQSPDSNHQCMDPEKYPWALFPEPVTSPPPSIKPSLERCMEYLEEIEAQKRVWGSNLWLCQSIEGQVPEWDGTTFPMFGPLAEDSNLSAFPEPAIGAPPHKKLKPE